MNTWKDHNGIKLFHELPKPFLFVVEDSSYVAYIKAYEGRLRLCEMYTSCEVIPIPQIVSKNFGGGWILPKDSPFSPILDLPSVV